MSIIPTGDSGYHYLPVPVEHVPQVMRFIADLTAPHEPASPRVAAAPEASLDDAVWSDEDLVEFANKDLATARNYRRIMGALAEREGEWMSIDEIAVATGLSRDVVKAFRTQMYRHIHAHYSYERAPFPGAWGADLVPRRDQVVWYRASAAQAEQWRRIQPKLDEL